MLYLTSRPELISAISSLNSEAHDLLVVPFSSGLDVLASIANGSSVEAAISKAAKASSLGYGLVSVATEENLGLPAGTLPVQ